MGFEPFRSAKEKVTHPAAAVVANKVSKPTVPHQAWPDNVDVNELPNFLRDDVPEMPPASWTAPFGWRP